MNSTTQFIAAWIRKYCGTNLPVDADSLREVFNRKVQEITEAGDLDNCDCQYNAAVVLDMVGRLSAGECLQTWSGIRRVKYLDWSKVSEHVNEERSKRPARVSNLFCVMRYDADDKSAGFNYAEATIESPNFTDTFSAVTTKHNPLTGITRQQRITVTINVEDVGPAPHPHGPVVEAIEREAEEAATV